MKNQAVNIEARSHEVIPLGSVMLVLFPGLAQAGKARVVPSASTDGSYRPVVELELTFVAGCQTDVLCLVPSKK